MFIGCAPLAAQTVNPQFVYSAGTSPPAISAFKLDATTGALTPVPGSPFNERLSPVVLAVDPAGKFLFIGNQTSNDVSVFKIDQTTGALTEAANSPFSSGNGTGPSYMAVDPTSKFLFVLNALGTANPNAGEIDVYEIDPSTGALTPSPNSLNPGTAMQGPPNIHGGYAHPNGKWLYVLGGAPTQSGCDLRQYQIDSNTGDLTVLVSPAPGLSCLNPASLTGDPQGNFLYYGFGQLVGSIASAQISSLDGSVSNVGSWNSLGKFEGVFAASMTVDSTGDYLFSNLGSFKVAGGVIVPIVVGPTSSPWVADLIGPYVYSGNSGVNGSAINPTNGTLTPTPGSPYTTASGSQFIAITGYPPQTPAPIVAFSPTTVALGSPLLGTSFTAPVQLFNTGTATLDINGISITGTDPGDFSQTNDCPATLGAGANCNFTVTFTPSVTGSRTVQLTVSDNAAGSPHSAILEGVGVSPSPTANLAPSSFGFPATIVSGSSAPQPFTLTNSGTGALHIMGIGFSGPNPGDFSQSNTCGATLAVNVRCTISVTFKPQAVGVRAANVSVTDDATTSPQSSSVSGTGTEPFAITPSGSSGTTVTFTPGQSSQYSAQFTSLPSFSGTVTFACMGAPTGTNCAVSPQSLPVTGPATTQLMVTVSPTGVATATPQRIVPDVKAWNAWQVSIFGLSLVLIIAIARADNYFCRFRLGHFAIASVLFAALLISACSGGQGQTTPPAPQPAPGSYPLTLVATSGNATASLNLTLNVQ